MKDVMGVDDVYKHAKEELSYTGPTRWGNDAMARSYFKEAQKYEVLSKKFKSTPLNKVDRMTIKEGQAILKDLKPTILGRALGIKPYE